MRDLAFFDWITKKRETVPTELELDEYYFQLDERKRLG